LTGIETGYNFVNSITNNNPSSSQTGSFHTLFRGLLGGELVKEFNSPFHGSAFFKRITFDSQYRLRLLARDEAAIRVVRKMGKDTDVAEASSKPRHYVANTLTFTLTDYFGLSVKHEYGQLPPAYPFVDNKATVTLTVQLKTSR
jgi:hypothetical protein